MARSQVRLSPAALVTRAGLFTYLHPRLAQDSKLSGAAYNSMVRGLTSKNYGARMPLVRQAVEHAVDGKLAMDDGIADLATLLQALKPQAEMADQAPGLGQINANPGGSAGPMSITGSPDQGGGSPTQDIVAKIKAYLEQEGIAPEILNNLDAFLAEHQPTNGGGNGNAGGPPPPMMGGGGPPMGGGADLLGGGPPPPVGPRAADRMVPRVQEAQDQESGEEIEGEPEGGRVQEMGPRGGEEGEMQSGETFDEEPDPWRDETTEDDEIPDEQSEQIGGVAKVSSEGSPSKVVNGGGQDRMPITRKAMDEAIRIAQDRAIRNQKAIRNAERFVRPWVGDLAMDANYPSDIYRAALKALNVRNVDKLHPHALRPILEAQPRPSVRLAADKGRRIAQDVKVEGTFADRFPDAMKIKIQ